MTKWISVKDRMPGRQPEGFRQYIVASFSHIKKTYHVGVFDFRGNDFYDPYGDKIFMDDGYWEITHWMPLPQPPTEASE